ncbi:MAG TPA: MATE family efflux transporter [Clostridiales bacterium]|jgi:putative MATE family efflux protein|nr:MATE family efflux transporter [Clostridiales bacterium]
MLRDLTLEKPSRAVITFSLPLVLSTVLQQTYNIANSVIVGRMVGSAALASVGAAYPITLFYIAVATGASMGSSVVISQLFGAKKLRDMKSAIFTSIVSLVLLGIALSLAGVLLSRPIMRLLNASPSILDASSAYLAVYSVGVLPMFIYNTSNAIFAGLGDAKRPLYFLFMSSVLNIFLCILAVGRLNLGVIGAAWATTASQLIAALLSTLILIRKIRSIKTEEAASLFEPRLFREICRISVPSIFQQSCVALAHTVVQSLVNTFSDSVIAGYEAAAKIHNFAYMSMNTIGTAFSSFAAQNYGAGRRDRIIEGYKVFSLFCLGVAAFIILIMQLFSPFLVGLFTSGTPDPKLIEVGVNFLRIISPDYLIICFIITSGGLLRGLGRTRDFFYVTVLDFAVRVAMSFFLTKLLQSYTGLFWSWYFGSALDLIVCLLIYRKMRTKGELRDAHVTA